jgi:hypothetical protein
MAGDKIINLQDSRYIGLIPGNGTQPCKYRKPSEYIFIDFQLFNYLDPSLNFRYFPLFCHLVHLVKRYLLSL